MAKKVIRVGRDPKDVFGDALESHSFFMAEELGDLADESVRLAKGFAPVYSQAKYPRYRKFAHAIQSGAGGTLRDSIRRRKVKILKTLMKTEIYSRVPYSDYQEDGFWHTRANKWIFGKEFISSAVDIVFKSKFEKHVSKAFRETYKRRR